MKKSTIIAIVVGALCAAALAACAAISAKMTKECEENKPCSIKCGLFRKK